MWNVLPLVLPPSKCGAKSFALNAIRDSHSFFSTFTVYFFPDGCHLHHFLCCWNHWSEWGKNKRNKDAAPRGSAVSEYLEVMEEIWDGMKVIEVNVSLPHAKLISYRRETLAQNSHSVKRTHCTAPFATHTKRRDKIQITIYGFLSYSHLFGLLLIFFFAKHTWLEKPGRVTIHILVCCHCW